VDVLYSNEAIVAAIHSAVAAVIGLRVFSQSIHFDKLILSCCFVGVMNK